MILFWENVNVVLSTRVHSGPLRALDVRAAHIILVTQSLLHVRKMSDQDINIGLVGSVKKICP